MNVTIEDRQDETTTVRFMGEEVKISVRFQPKEGQSSRGVITSYQVEDHCHLMIERGRRQSDALGQYPPSCRGNAGYSECLLQ